MDVQSQNLFAAGPERFSDSIPVNSSVPATDVARLSAQCRVVLDVLRVYGKITPAQARGMGIHRLAARIGDLKKAGYAIEMTGMENKEAVYQITPAGRERVGGRA